MQYIPCNSALLAQKTLFLTQMALFFKFTKVLGFGQAPPPMLGKIPNNIVFFYESVPTAWSFISMLFIAQGHIHTAYFLLCYVENHNFPSSKDQQR